MHSVQLFFRILPQSNEIFTLAHEVGHYLLQSEEIEEIDFAKITENTTNLSDIERWCNTFAYYLLLGPDNAAKLDSIAIYDCRIDYGHDIIEAISKATNLSRLAIFTNIFLQRKMTFEDYSNVREDLHQQWLTRKENEKLKRECDREAGIPQRGSTPKPIQLNLVYEIYNYALNRGVVSEREYCTALNIKSNDISRMFYEGPHLYPFTETIRGEFSRRVYGGCKRLPGLVRRRKMEADLYFS